MLVFAVASIVQAQDGWEIQLEYVWMDAYGYDEHVGDVVRYREEYSVDEARNYTLDYGATYEPINLNLKDKSSLRGELIYRKGQWFLGLSGWTFDNHIGLESTAEANLDSMIGPVLGFQGEAKRGKFRIEGFINHAVLFGKAEQTGIWIDIDDILWIDPVTGETVWHDVFAG